MKKSLLAVVMLCMFATSATTVLAADGDKKEPHIAGFVSNPFKSNWELQAGVGATFNLATGEAFKDIVGYGGHIGTIKWFHPVFGIRLDVELGKFNQGLFEGRYHDIKGWSYLTIHPDFMINLSNWIGGYKQHRVYNSIIYMGAGYGFGYLYGCECATHSHNFVANFGWQNRFYVSDAVSIDLQFQYTLAKNDFRPYKAAKADMFHGLLTTLGVTYRFNDRNFYRSGATVDEVAAWQKTIDDYKAQAENANADRDAMAKELEKQKADALKAAELLAAERAAMERERVKAPKQAESAKEAVETDNYDEILFHQIGHSALTEYHKKRLDLVAEHIKADDTDKVYKIDGFADANTGTKEINSQLAGKRARLAYDYLLSKGVPADRMQYNNCGTLNVPFAKPLHNRVVVIY